MQRRNTVKSTILNATSHELKLLLRGILFPASLAFFFIYVIISIIDIERTGFFNSIPSSIILAIGTVVSLKLFLAIAVPYPSIADIFYLSATVFLSFHLYNTLYIKKSILKN